MTEDPNTLISQDGMAYRYIESQAGVHLEFFTFPGRTLCGFEFDPEGHLVSLTATNFGRQQEPFLPTAKRVVTCPRCVNIIKVCQAVQIAS
jgi:hypothetical protein